MEEARDRIVSLPAAGGAAEERRLGADLVSEMAARKDRGAGIKPIARELEVDRQSVKRWLKLGAWQPRQVPRRARQLDRFAPLIERRAPAAGCNALPRAAGAGLHGRPRASTALAAATARATQMVGAGDGVRCETGPGEQAQADYGQLQAWLGGPLEQQVHRFVFTLGYARRLDARGYHHERLATLRGGRERALRWCGGVTLSCLYDNPRNLVLGRRAHKVLGHPQHEDFARCCGFTPRACPP